MGMMFTVGTLNVRGLSNRKKQLCIDQWFQHNKLDILFIQETYHTESDKKILHDFDGKIYHSRSNSKHSRGVCTLISSKLFNNQTFEIVNIHADKEGRLLIINIKLHNKQYSLVNMYCPNNNTERGNYFNECGKFIKEKCTTPEHIIVGGDFNCVSEQTDKQRKVTNISDNNYNRFIDNIQLVDIWRIQHPNEVQYTYIDPSNRQYSSRIDKVLISKTLSQKSHNSRIIHAPTPDHKAVIVDMKDFSLQRGKGYWKLNASI